MPLPQPPVDLGDDVCSVIFNNTLYAYSSKAFQALPLTPGAQWKQLPSGESVTGGVCVGSTPADADRAGFFVVGGKGPSMDYKGLQKFTYATGKWETITPSALVTQQRLWHSAVYLNASNSILMYAGAQDGSLHASSQTFTIQADAPYLVASYESIAPPTIKPILLPWSDSQAVLLGGSDFNTNVMLFSPQTAWVDSGASLAVPIPKNTTSVKAVLVGGDDGCKNLYTFDMTISPNQVNRTVLVDGAKRPVQKAAPVTSPGKAARRAVPTKSLTLDDWPQYNSTFVSKAVRTSYAMAEDPNGLIVIAGGNSDDVLCMFDGRGNGWVNATERLTDQAVLAQGVSPSSPSSSASGTPSATAAPSATSSAAAVATDSSSPLSVNTILGIVLGSIAGLAVLLVVLYILIRQRRRRQDFVEAGHNRRSSGVASPEKGGYGYASDSLAPAMAKGTFRGHHPQESSNSFSSTTILMGRVNQQNQGIQRKNSKEKRNSIESLYNKAFKSTISKPIPQEQGPVIGGASLPVIDTRDERGVSFGPEVAEAQPRPRAPKVDRQGSTRRSSGWNRYWSGGSTLNILGFGNGKGGGGSGGGGGVDSRRTTVDSDQSSQYSADAHRITQDSATVPPLHVAPMVQEPKPKFQRVNSGSPTMANYDNRIRDEMRARIERSNSRTSEVSGYSSGIPASVPDSWDPTQTGAAGAGVPHRPFGHSRKPSSNYSANFTAGPGPAVTPGLEPPTGVSRQPQLKQAAVSSDMSWLNLGDFSRQM